VLRGELVWVCCGAFSSSFETNEDLGKLKLRENSASRKVGFEKTQALETLKFWEDSSSVKTQVLGRLKF
jgi:hypothetical protein